VAAPGGNAEGNALPRPVGCDACSKAL